MAPVAPAATACPRGPGQVGQPERQALVQPQPVRAAAEQRHGRREHRAERRHADDQQRPPARLRREDRRQQAEHDRGGQRQLDGSARPRRSDSRRPAVTARPPAPRRPGSRADDRGAAAQRADPQRREHIQHAEPQPRQHGQPHARRRPAGPAARAIAARRPWGSVSRGPRHRNAATIRTAPATAAAENAGPGAHLAGDRPDHRAEQGAADRRAQRRAEQLAAPLRRGDRGQPGHPGGPGAGAAHALDEPRGVQHDLGVGPSRRRTSTRSSGPGPAAPPAGSPAGRSAPRPAATRSGCRSDRRRPAGPRPTSTGPATCT